MLELKNITWTLPDGKKILNDVSFTIPDGRLVVMTGPNGSGKTSLAKIIAGIEPPTSGKILLDGKDITGLDVTQRALMGISYAFQQPVRFKGFTVRDLLNIAAGKVLTTTEEKDLLGQVGLCLCGYIDRDLNASFSGGEMKRIEIASVLARGSRLCVFDEPEAGIDLWSFRELIRIFEEMKANSMKTQIIISHQERILEIADDIIAMTGGRLSAMGGVGEVLPMLLGSQCGSCPVARS